MASTAQLEVQVVLKGVWRVQLLVWIQRLLRCKRLTMALLRSGWCDPWFRVNRQRWRRIRLADKVEWSEAP